MTYTGPHLFFLPPMALLTPVSIPRAAFLQDRDYFNDSKNKGRRFAIRSISEGEADHFSLVRPKIYVSVARVSAALHLVQPVWFGWAFFETQTFGKSSYADVRSDDEIAAIIAQSCERGWYDKAAWIEYRP